MRITKDKSDDSKNLREQAEERAKQQIVEFRKQRQGQDTAELIHELRVHQIELEIQNEELRNTQLELAESRNKYCELYDFAPVGYFTLNKEGLIVEANLTGAAFLGEERDNLLKSKFSHFVAPGSQDEFYLHRKQVVESGARQSCEVKLHRKDGTEFPAQLVSVAVAEQKGEYDRFRMTMTDITERKRSEEALQTSEERFRLVIENAPFGYYRVGKDGLWQHVNPAWEQMHGYSLKDVVGKSFEITQTREDVEKARQHVKRALAGETITGEFSRITKQGTVKYHSFNIQPVRWGNEIVAIEGFIDDITERKRAEEVLRENKERLQEERNLLRTLIDHIPGGIYVKDKDGRFLACNKPLAEFWEVRGKDDIIGKTDFDLFEPERAQHYFDEEQKVIQTGQPIINQESQCTDKSGIANFLLVTKVPLRDSTGNITGLVGIHRDITERKKAEQKLLEYQKKLKRLAAQLALAEERERRRIAGELHDQVTQSLALAKIKLDTLHAAASSQPLAQALEDISGSIEKAIQNTRSLTFDLSSPILHELGFEAAVAEWLNEQVRDKRGISTEFQDDDRPKPLDDDMRVLLFRNVRELLINVIKHANAGKVMVHIRRIDGSIEVTVKDNGVGFDPMEVRTMAAKRTGFGLFSIRESLEELGGRFEIESKPGAGSKATMTAPLKGESRKKEE